MKCVCLVHFAPELLSSLSDLERRSREVEASC